MPHRIVHVFNGFENSRRQTLTRTGVVLSDGSSRRQLRQIGQMEIVPDLVFLNCCHLAKANLTPIAYNRLAYSISRQSSRSACAV